MLTPLYNFALHAFFDIIMGNKQNQALFTDTEPIAKVPVKAQSKFPRKDQKTTYFRGSPFTVGHVGRSMWK